MTIRPEKGRGNKRWAAVLPLVLMAVFLARDALANPEGGSVVAGQATISGEGTTNVIVNQASDRALIEWRDFSIGVGETTRFVQPGADAIAANRVIGVSPSQVLGNLEANGRVVLINRNGILFGSDARVDAAGLIATVHDLENASLMDDDAPRFDISGENDASVVNAGSITVRDTGLAALVAPRAHNSGTIRAGRVALAGANGFAVDLNGDGLLRFAPGDILESVAGEGALVDVAGRIEADGGEIRLSAHAAEAVVNASVNVSGVVRARRISTAGGVIHLEGPGEIRVSSGASLDASGDGEGGEIAIDAGAVVSEGSVLSEGSRGAGGEIRILGDRVGLGGRVSATGSTGGAVRIGSTGLLSLGERIEARGTAGPGGTADFSAGRIVQTVGASIDVSGTVAGGRIVVDGGSQVASSGNYRASGTAGRGGRIDITATDVRLLSAKLDTSGSSQGGLVRIGGGVDSGAAPDRDAVWYESLVGRWGDLPVLAPAREVLINDGAQIDVSSSGGTGGAAVVWSRERTTFLGSIDARGGAGGAVRLSSAGELRHDSLDQVLVGAGHLVIDPGSLTVASDGEGQAWAYAGAVGLATAGPTGVKRQDVDAEGPDVEHPRLIDVASQRSSEFGTSVALNAAGDLLAVGVPRGADPRNRGNQSFGAVYLFTFSDRSFSGGALAATVGEGHAGGRNVDVRGLANGEFGASVALNAAGDRLAVGAPATMGQSGAVYLLSFRDGAFSDGELDAVIGEGRTGGKNIGLESLEEGSHSQRFGWSGGDRFGASVALNGSGNRLAVGAPGDDGPEDRTSRTGATYLFAFADNAYSAGRLVATIGKGYTGERDVDVAELHAVYYTHGYQRNDGSGFGSSVSLNAAGDRLAVGAPNQFDIDKTVRPESGVRRSRYEYGAVFLFTFTNDSFSGGTLAAILGKGYAGEKNLDIPVHDGDRFGAAVSLNGSGDRLAVGAPGDDGRSGVSRHEGNDHGVSVDAGAVYLYRFADRSFSEGELVGSAGLGHAGDGNINLTGLDGKIDYADFVPDSFGASVSLNGSGDRMAVGAPGDDGPGNVGGSSTGAVYLFAFADGSFGGARLAAIAGRGYAAKNLQVEWDDDDTSTYEGGSVSLNSAGDRLAVGAPRDDGGPGNTIQDTGAVYLFSFSDRAFSGGVLEAIIGKNYTGGKNIDIDRLEKDDYFGASVALNAVGDRLAVGARSDDGPENVSRQSGAVYLFTFADGDFSGGEVAHVLGSAYTSDQRFITHVHNNPGERYHFGNSVSLNGSGDRLAVATYGSFGSYVHLFTFTDTSFSGAALADSIYAFSRARVSLNGAGDRLAVGAPSNRNDDSWPGRVFLYTFEDDAFSGRTLVARIGKGLTGDNDVNVPELEGKHRSSSNGTPPGDHFGNAVSLNAAGDRLAVGAHWDDGPFVEGGGWANSGAVYLFGFEDGSFSGGRLMAVLGKGYAGGKNIDVAALDAGTQHDSPNQFGGSVSLNGAGDRLAVGDRVRDRVFLFTFEDTAFSGGALAATLGQDVASGPLSGAAEGVAVPGEKRGPPGDLFGTSVSLNAAGDRLAVGAPGNDDIAGRTRNTGAVYLFTFKGTSFSDGALAAIVGKGYSAGRSVDVAELGEEDLFGASVSLNATGDRLAVGAPGDDGAGDTRYEAGAVYLFTFADRSFYGGELAAIVGRDRIGEKDISPDGLSRGDDFGRAVALNAAGDRLAVGAPGDDGGSNGRQETGAVYLFKFDDSSFSGGTVAAILGRDYFGGTNIHATVEDGDRLGRSVSLNGAGDRLAVGAPFSDGADNGSRDAGAVYLYTFQDPSFAGARLAATIGKGHVGANDVDQSTLEAGDLFGASVSLNAAGDRLAVGAWEEQAGTLKSGTVYLYAFRDSRFAGARLARTLGSAFPDERDVHVPNLFPHDSFGSVSLNASGDRLAVGAYRDEVKALTGDLAADHGAVYLFTFSDESFGGAALSTVVGKDRGSTARVVGGSAAPVHADRTEQVNAVAVDTTASMSADGTRLAVGAWSDDPRDDGGTVYLFAFSDRHLTQGALAAIVGKGHAGGANVDVANLESGDQFGSAVALNPAGDRLAVGAPGDDGADNRTPGAGAAYLFAFYGQDISDGALEAIIGRGYGGDANVGLDTLWYLDGFGSSVALNATGDRLAVGAAGDDGADNVAFNSGAVYLFTFDGRFFEDGALAATIGAGYRGGQDIAPETLERFDGFGSSVALNASGDRLAVGAAGDDGADNVAFNSGAAYLFRFDATNFGNGTLMSTIGDGYTGDGDIDLAVSASGGALGVMVTLDRTGRWLAVGEKDERGGVGAVHLLYH